MALEFSFALVRGPAVTSDRTWVEVRPAGSIGWATDEHPMVLVGSNALDGAAEHESLVATARPTDTRRPALTGGVVALRWFELAAPDWDEFLTLSTGAWPAFEEAYDATILGLFRTTASPSEDEARALLVTRYASYAEWERSRGGTRAESGTIGEAGRLFRRRAQLTRRSIVRVGAVWTPG